MGLFLLGRCGGGRAFALLRVRVDKRLVALAAVVAVEVRRHEHSRATTLRTALLPQTRDLTVLVNLNTKTVSANRH